jgi:hypothetical protein
LTLEELHVLEESRVIVDNDKNHILILFTPTIPHCSMVNIKLTLNTIKEITKNKITGNTNRTEHKSQTSSISSHTIQSVGSNHAWHALFRGGHQQAVG